MKIEKRSEEIVLSKNIKGKIVRAVDKHWPSYQWVLLISHVEPIFFNDSMYYKIYCHVAYCRKNCGIYVDNPPKYLFIDKYFQLYEPTEDDREAIKNILKNKKLKFIKILNKLIGR